MTWALIESAWASSIASKPAGPSARNAVIAGCAMDGFGEIASCASFSFVAIGLRESDSIFWKDSKAFSTRTGVEGTAPQLRIVFKVGAVTVSAKFDSAARMGAAKLRKSARRKRCVFMAKFCTSGEGSCQGQAKEM